MPSIRGGIFNSEIMGIARKFHYQNYLPEIMKRQDLSILNTFRNEQFTLLPHLPPQHIPIIVHQEVTVLTAKPGRNCHRTGPYELTALVTRAQQEALLHIPRAEHGLGATYEQALTPVSVIWQSEAHGHGLHGLAGSGKQPPIRHFREELRDFWHPKQDSSISALARILQYTIDQETIDPILIQRKWRRIQVDGTLEIEI